MNSLLPRKYRKNPERWRDDFSTYFWSIILLSIMASILLFIALMLIINAPIVAAIIFVFFAGAAGVSAYLAGRDG